MRNPTLVKWVLVGAAVAWLLIFFVAPAVVNR